MAKAVIAYDKDLPEIPGRRKKDCTLPPWFTSLSKWRSEFEAMLDGMIRYMVNDKKIEYVLDFKMTNYSGLYSCDPHEIKLSPYQGETEARESFGHEYAHFVVKIVYGDQDSHGLLWQLVMSSLGLPANQTNTMPLKFRKNVSVAVGKAIKKNSR